MTYDTGMGTSPGMWEMLSEMIEGEKLPESLNKALYALREGAARVMTVAEDQESGEQNT